MQNLIAPIANPQKSAIHHEKKPWEGSIKLKPWQYEVTAVIPCINSPVELFKCVQILQLQFIKPYIIIVDTGSTPENCIELEKLRSSSVEIHYIKSHAYRHPSDPVASAMDLGFSLAQSEYVFCTHSDCFLMNQLVIGSLVEKCNSTTPIVGYQLTERSFEGWEKMVGHTCTMIHLPTYDKIGASWSQRRLARAFGLESQEPHKDRLGFPDTELLVNYIFMEHGFDPLIIGTEENYKRNKDSNIDHCRSIASARLYSPSHLAVAETWMATALNEAQQRINKWTFHPSSVESVQIQNIVEPAVQSDPVDVWDSFKNQFKKLKNS